MKNHLSNITISYLCF